MKTLTATITLISAFGTLCGCGVGLGGFALYTTETRLEHFELFGRGEVFPESSTTEFDQEWVEETWGPPDSITVEAGGVVVWRYKGKRKWTGIIPVVLLPIPIPFIVPTGSDRVDLHFRDGIAFEVNSSFGVVTGIISPWDQYISIGYVRNRMWTVTGLPRMIDDPINFFRPA